MGQKTSTVSGNGGNDMEITSGELLIPLDIINILLELLDRDSLEKVSLLNKNIHRFVNRRLWRSVEIHDRSMSSQRKRRKMMTDACEAVTRDLHRAACIQTLTIRFSRLSSFSFLLRRPMRSLAEALAASPNLKTLRIQSWSYHTKQLSRILCCPLSGPGYPFLLNSFTCMGALHNAIGPFIQNQYAITDYSIDEDSIYFDEKNKSDDYVEADDQSPRPLPRIRRFKGPSQYVRRILCGRSVDTVEVTASVADDIQRLHDSFYSFTRAQRDAIVAGNGQQTIARNVSLNLWTSAEEQHHFPFLIRISHQISLNHIRSLKLQSWSMLNRDTVPPALKLFPILEYFEWDMSFTLDVGSDCIVKLILDCAQNSPHLRRITLSNARGFCCYRIWTRVPVDSLTPDDDVVPCVVAPEEHPSLSQVTLFTTSSSEAPVQMAPIREGCGFAWKMEVVHDDGDHNWEISQ